MWSDKETTEDLLGYTVHASLLKSVVTIKKTSYYGWIIW